MARLKELTMLTICRNRVFTSSRCYKGLDNLESLSVKTCPLLEVPFFSVKEEKRN